MRPAFYDSEEYKEKQRRVTKANVEKGVYEHLRREVHRMCAREGCLTSFVINSGNPKKYCGSSCAAKTNNKGRTQSKATRKKISLALSGNKNALGKVYVAPTTLTCTNCGRGFTAAAYKKRKYCSSTCAIKAIGSRPTSAKASRGKSGIRPDISESINFHSTWEANVARMYSHLGIEWKYEPITFDIGGHTYTPDFYLPKYDEYLEVKNFWSNYSAERDKKFRMTHPSVYLRVLLRDEYFALQKLYSQVVPNWEFSGRK